MEWRSTSGTVSSISETCDTRQQFTGAQLYDSATQPYCRYVLDTALLEWISEYAVRAYTTPDSAVSYLKL